MTGKSLTAIQAAWASGKTSGLVFYIALLAQTRVGAMIPWVVDTSTRISNVVQPECQKWLPALGWKYSASLHRWLYPKTNTSLQLLYYYRPQSREPVHNTLEGVNASDGVVDECQTLPEEVFGKLIGRCRTHPNPRIVLSGLPVAASRAWWSHRAAENDGLILQAQSFVNKENLGEGWFKNLEGLSKEEYETLVLNQPSEFHNAIYSSWSNLEWPEGNLVTGWQYQEDLTCRAAIDFGGVKPHVLFIAEAKIHHPKFGIVPLDIIFDEIVGQQQFTLTHELAQLILNKAWPRHHRNPPAGKYLLDKISGDPAGKQRDRHSGESDIDLFAKSPAAGGIGMRIQTPADPVRRSIEAGITRTQRRILGADGFRYLAMTRELWDSSADLKKASLRRSLEGYSRGVNGVPQKINGFDDAADSLRYDTVVFSWWDNNFGQSAPKMPNLIPLQPRMAARTGAR